LEVEWERVDAWLADERWVPKDDPRSNGLMAGDALLDNIDATFHRPRWAPWLEPADSAAHYEAELRHIHGERGPDLVLLGMGEDGHTASLFPGSGWREPTDRWYIDAVASDGMPRLSATLNLLAQAERIFFLVSGSGKAEMVRRAVGHDPELPAGGVGAFSTVTWLVDKAAAEKLNN
jgi:6-phosphogluconolactonase